MKSLKIFLGLLVFTSAITAQEIAPNFLTYRYNMNILNPAYAGSNDYTEFNLGFRKEALGLDDDPSAQFLSFSKALKKNVGIGLSLLNDKTFVTKQTNIAVDVSYKLQLDRTTNVYFGLKAGGAIYKIDLNSLAPNDPLFGDNVSKFNPTIGFGALLKGERFYANLSVPNLLVSSVQKPKMDSSGNVISEETNDEMHFYLGTGYRMTLNENFEVTPSIFTRLVPGQKAMIDISALTDISKLIEIGLTYRVDTSIIGSVLLKVTDNTHFGYAYESVNSDLATISNGTHEFVLRFKFF